MADEEEDEIDEESKEANQSMVVCNICGRRFSEKADLSEHVRSAHFGMKENEEDSLEVIHVDDGMEDKLSSESDEEVTIDSDCVCQICYSIFKDSTDLKAHTRLAHSGSTTKSLLDNSENDPRSHIRFDSDQPNASAQPVFTSNLKHPSAEPGEACEKTASFAGIHYENLTTETGKRTTAILDNVSVYQVEESVTGLHSGAASNCLGGPENDEDKNDPQFIEKNECVSINDDTSDQPNVQSVEEKRQRVVCNICVQEFETKEILNVHIKSTHFGISSYKCAMCSLSFESRNQVIKHYNNCNGESQVDKIVKDPLIEATVTVNGDKKVMKKRKVRTKRLLKTRAKEKVHTKEKVNKKTALKESSRTSARLAEKNLSASSKMSSSLINQLSKLREKTASQLRSRKRVIVRKEKDGRTANQKSTKKEVKMHQGDAKIRGSTVQDNQKKIISRRTKNIPQMTHDQRADIGNCDPKRLGYDSVRPCYICGERFYSSNNELDHMIEKHREYAKPIVSQVSLLKLKREERFKCLRCGKVGLLNVIQCHVQLKCLRSPFYGEKALRNFYCTVCGEHFGEAHLHDIHVASVHYSHLYKPDSGHYASIPFPHILLYHISPKVCQHCGKNCQFTIKSKNAAENAFLQQVSCIEGPYVCPYGHTKRQSRCTLDLLLHHLKFCAYRSGVLALQCNNCFKMLLCNNAPDQVDQLREIVKMDYLECCSDTEKSFKCYCCTRDYSWSVVTEQLKASIKRLDHARSNSKNVNAQRILTLNPSVHTKGPQIIAKKMGGSTESHDSVLPLDDENLSPLLDVKRRRTSFDVIESNLALIRQKRQKSLITVNEKTSINKTDLKPPGSGNVHRKNAPLATGPIKITNTYKPSEQQDTTVAVDEIARKSDKSYKNPTITQSVQQNTKYQNSKQSTENQTKSLKPIEQPDTFSITLGTKKNVHTHTGKDVIEHNLLGGKVIHADDLVLCMICSNKPDQTPESTTEYLFHSAKSFLDHIRKAHERERKLLLHARSPKFPYRLIKRSEIHEIGTLDLPDAKEPVTKISDAIGNQEDIARKNETCSLEHSQKRVLLAKGVIQPYIIEEINYEINPTMDFEGAKVSVNHPVEEVLPVNAHPTCNKINAPSKQTLGGKAATTPKLSVCKICVSQSSSKPVFYDERSLVLHMMEHRGEQEQVFICYDCGSKWSNQYLWKTHIRFHHPYCVILQCDYKNCSMEFQRPQDLQDHIFSEHSHTFGCAICLIVFRTEEELQIHSNVLHGTA